MVLCIADERRQDRQERSRPSAPFNPPDSDNESSRSLVDLYDEVMELQDELYSDMYTDNSSLFSETHRSLLDFSALVNCLVILCKMTLFVLCKLARCLAAHIINIVCIFNNNEIFLRLRCSIFPDFSMACWPSLYPRHTKYIEGI